MDSDGIDGPGVVTTSAIPVLLGAGKYASRHVKRYGGRLPDTARVGTVQYMQRRVKSFEEFLFFVGYFVDVVADYKGDFVVFPEMYVVQLLSIHDQQLKPAQSIESLTEHTPAFVAAMRDAKTSSMSSCRVTSATCPGCRIWTSSTRGAVS